MKHATRHSSLTRIIAIGMVCLFLVNSVSRAYPDVKTNTLAPKDLATHEDRALSFQKFAVAYITKKLREKDKSTLGTVETLWSEIRKKARTSGLRRDEIPERIGRPVDGAIRIVFASGCELIFYDPHIKITHDNPRAWYYDARRKKEIEGDIEINRYLRQQFIRGESEREFRGKVYEEKIRLVEKYRRVSGFYKLSHLHSTDEAFYRVLRVAEALESIEGVEITVEAFEKRYSAPLEHQKSLLMKKTNVDADIVISLKDRTGNLASGKYFVEVKGGRTTANRMIHNFFKEKQERLKQWSRYKVIAEKGGFKGVILAMDKDTPYYPKGKIIKYEDEPWFYLFFGVPGAPEEAPPQDRTSHPRLMGDRVYINFIRNLARNDTPPHRLLRVDHGPGLHGGIATLEVAKEGLSSSYPRYLISQAIKIYRVLTEPDFDTRLLRDDAPPEFYREQKETLRELAGILTQDKPELCEVYIRLARDNRNNGTLSGLSVSYKGKNGARVHGFIPDRYIPEFIKKNPEKIKEGRTIYTYLIQLRDGYRPIFAIGLDKAQAESKAVRELRKAFDKREPVEVTIVRRSYNDNGWVVRYKNTIKWGFLPDKEIAGGAVIAEGKTMEAFIRKVNAYPDSYVEFSMESPHGIDNDIGSIEENVKDIIPHLVNTLIAWADRIEEKKERAALVLDIPPEKFGKTKDVIDDCVIRYLTLLDSNNETIRKILQNIEIVGRGKIKVIERRLADKRLKPENVVIVTDESRLESFEEFKNCFITALDASELEREAGFDWESYYYPYVEAAFFALMRAVSYDESGRDGYRKNLWKWYRQIPNVKKIDYGALMELCVDEGNPKRKIIIELIPNAKKIEYKDLEKIYERIQEFIRKA